MRVHPQPALDLLDGEVEVVEELHAARAHARRLDGLDRVGALRRLDGVDRLAVDRVEHVAHEAAARVGAELRRDRLLLGLRRRHVRERVAQRPLGVRLDVGRAVERVQPVRPHLVEPRDRAALAAALAVRVHQRQRGAVRRRVLVGAVERRVALGHEVLVEERAVGAHHRPPRELGEVAPLVGHRADRAEADRADQPVVHHHVGAVRARELLAVVVLVGEDAGHEDVLEPVEHLAEGRDVLVRLLVEVAEVLVEERRADRVDLVEGLVDLPPQRERHGEDDHERQERRHLHQQRAPVELLCLGLVVDVALADGRHDDRRARGRLLLAPALRRRLLLLRLLVARDQRDQVLGVVAQLVLLVLGDELEVDAAVLVVEALHLVAHRRVGRPLLVVGVDEQHVERVHLEVAARVLLERLEVVHLVHAHHHVLGLELDAHLAHDVVVDLERRLARRGTRLLHLDLQLVHLVTQQVVERVVQVLLLRLHRGTRRLGLRAGGGLGVHVLEHAGHPLRKHRELLLARAQLDGL